MPFKKRKMKDIVPKQPPVNYSFMQNQPVNEYQIRSRYTKEELIKLNRIFSKENQRSQQFKSTPET